MLRMASATKTNVLGIRIAFTPSSNSGSSLLYRRSCLTLFEAG